ncbi:hypothetical protein [Maricaulis parjimensis]|uniref:hypothetical protein n=1 Tax=Maricaulis parjimensis TaxID=144023 RepID=UPI00193A06EC|nr:hypothetical protein [Maricaulis parjimensis]
MLDRWARWIIFAGVSIWAVIQLRYFFDAVLIFAGYSDLRDLDRSYVEVIVGLNPLELTLSLLNPPLYMAASILIGLRHRFCLPVFGAALLCDLGGWLSYSMSSAYDQIEQSNFDWVINTGLLIALMGLITLRQRGYFAPKQS